MNISNNLISYGKKDLKGKIFSKIHKIAGMHVDVSN